MPSLVACVALLALLSFGGVNAQFTGFTSIPEASRSSPRKCNPTAPTCSSGLTNIDCFNVAPGSGEVMTVRFNTSSEIGRQAVVDWSDGLLELLLNGGVNYRMLVDGKQYFSQHLLAADCTPNRRSVMVMITREVTEVSFAPDPQPFTASTATPTNVLISGQNQSGTFTVVRLFVSDQLPEEQNPLVLQANSQTVPYSCSTDFCGSPIGCKLHGCFYAGPLPTAPPGPREISATFSLNNAANTVAQLKWTDGMGSDVNSRRAYQVFLSLNGGPQALVSTQEIQGCKTSNPIHSVVFAAPANSAASVTFRSIATREQFSGFVILGTGTCNDTAAESDVAIEVVGPAIPPNPTTGVPNSTTGQFTTTGIATTTTSGGSNATSAPLPSEDESSEATGSDNLGLYIGLGAGGGALVFGICVGLIVFLVMRKKAQGGSDPMEMQGLSHAPSGISTPNPGGNGPPSFFAGSYEATIGGNDVYSPVPQSPAPGMHGDYASVPSGGLKKKPTMTGIFLIDFSEVHLGDVLGKGGYGVVYLGKYQGEECAVKMMKTEDGSSLTKHQIQEFQDEAALMYHIKPHDNVCRFMGICNDPLLILTELCRNGSVHEYIKKHGELDRPTVVHIVQGVARGMAHLHKEGIVHRDLAARNVLLTTNMVAKISDFGLSRVIDKTASDGDSVGQTKTEVGPLKWMAPECLRFLQYSNKTDVWAFSVTLYEIICGCEPYQGMGAVQVATGVSQGELKLELPPHRGHQWPEVKDLMDLCMNFEPSDRPDFDQICQYMNAWNPYATGY